MADAAAVDRGDLIAPEVEVPEIETPEVEVPEVEAAEAPEPEAKEAKEPEPEEPARDEKGKFIPLNRHEKVLSNERAARETAERKLAELQASLQQVDRNADAEKLESEIVELEKSHSRLLLDGDHEEAAKAMTQIRLKERTIAIQQAGNLSASAKNEMREELRMDATIDSLEANYEVMNPQSEAFDQDIVDFVLSTQASLIQNERLSPSAALMKAAQKVMGKFAPTQPAADTEGKGLAAGKGGADRKTEQVAKNIDAAKKQPASMKESGVDSDKAGITSSVEYGRLTAEERSALPAATRAKLRGDML